MDYVRLVIRWICIFLSWQAQVTIIRKIKLNSSFSFCQNVLLSKVQVILKDNCILMFWIWTLFSNLRNRKYIQYIHPPKCNLHIISATLCLVKWLDHTQTHTRPCNVIIPNSCSERADSILQFIGLSRPL